MPYPIEKKLVIAVSSSAVFDMIAADNIYRTEGEEAYRKYQLEHIDKPFNKGVAFPFVKRLLGLNEIYAKEQPVEVIVLSRNDPDSGRRFFRTCQHFGLKITRGAFLTGKSPYPYIPAFSASLFLSANNDDVCGAITAGMPAGLVLPTISSDDDEKELRVAFDFDGVLADDEAETVYNETNDLELFHAAELKKSATPHNPGPLKDLITKMAYFQKMEMKKTATIPGYKPALRVAIVTARDAPSNERLVTTLNAWGLTAIEAFFMGGIEKKRVLDILRPHIFFDDQLQHLKPTAATVPSVHIPFGIKNRPPALAKPIDKMQAGRENDEKHE
jgi:5'-nucleotidase